jgi:hypothetical protein
LWCFPRLAEGQHAVAQRRLSPQGSLMRGHPLLPLVEELILPLLGQHDVTRTTWFRGILLCRLE